MSNKIVSKKIKTSDGVILNYLEAGKGQPLLMIHGISQTAELFKHQIIELSKYYRCIAVDLRGHGDSEKVEFGYRISRLAKDIHDIIDELKVSY
jgi:non-heme chloroperoxidase